MGAFGLAGPCGLAMRVCSGLVRVRVESLVVLDRETPFRWGRGVGPRLCHRGAVCAQVVQSTNTFDGTPNEDEEALAACRTSSSGRPVGAALALLTGGAPRQQQPGPSAAGRMQPARVLHESGYCLWVQLVCWCWEAGGPAA